MDNYKIIMTGHGNGKIFKNNEQIKGVIGVEFVARPSQPNIIKLEFAADTIEIEAECESHG